MSALVNGCYVVGKVGEENRGRRNMHHCLWGMDAPAHRFLRPSVSNTVCPPADSYLTSSVPSNFHTSVRPPPIHLFFLRPSVQIKKIHQEQSGPDQPTRGA